MATILPTRALLDDVVMIDPPPVLGAGADLPPCPFTPQVRKVKKKTGGKKSPPLGVAESGVAKAGKKKSRERAGEQQQRLGTALALGAASQGALAPATSPYALACLALQRDLANRVRSFFRDPAQLPQEYANPNSKITAEEFMGKMVADTLGFTTGRRLEWLKIHDGISKPLSEFFVAQADAVCSNVPVRTKDYTLTFGQVCTVFYLAYGNPVPITFGYEIDKVVGAQRFKGDDATAKQLQRSVDYKFTHMQDPGCKGLRISCMPTGTGKTVVTTAALLTALLSAKGSRQAERMYFPAARDPHTGARTVSGQDASYDPRPRIAPLVLVLCPPALENNWANAAKDLRAEVQRLAEAGVFQSGEVRVWQGNPSKEKRSVESVYLDGIPTVWVLPASPESLKVMYMHDDIGIRGFALDEGAHLATRYTGPLSPVCGPRILAQATPEKLRDHLGRKGNLLVQWLSTEALPLSRRSKETGVSGLDDLFSAGAFGILAKNIRQASKDGLVFVPEVLLKASAFAASEHMPAGIKMYQLCPKNETICEMLAKGSLAPGPLDELLRTWCSNALNAICREVSSKLYLSFAVEQFPAAEFVQKTEAGHVVDFDLMAKIGDEKVQEVTRGLLKQRKKTTPKFAERETVFKEVCNKFGDEVAANFRAFSGCPCLANERDIKPCKGGKINFSTSSRTCAMCAATYEYNQAFSLENLEPGKSNHIEASALGLITNLLDKCIAEFKRIVLYTSITSRSFLEKFDVELLMLTDVPESTADGTANRRGPNKHKRAGMVDRFNEPPLPGQRPFVIVLGRNDLLGTDLQHVDVIITYGHISKAEEKQVAGRGLRMSSLPVKEKYVKMYMM